MKVEQIYTSCIAEAAYYIESDGEAAVIDPLREFEPYINKADEDGAKIKYIFETHFHADFVSGHLDLSKKTGAEIVFGPTAKAGFDIIAAEDNQVFEIGKIKIKVLHTPGHTMESVTYMLIDENGNEHAIFTGDTLFLGDVGRPDLAVKSDLTEVQLAEFLYDSLRTKIMPLSDDIVVYPGHGAGSSCGKNLSDETVDTLGHQKRTNYALRPDMTKKEFVDELLDGILPPPQYFPKNAMMNKMGYESIDAVMHRGNLPLSVDEFEAKMKAGALVLDVRHEDDYRESHIPGSLYIGLDGNFAMWVGALIEDLKQQIIVVCPEERHHETVMRLARVGYDEAHGFLNGGMKVWEESGREVESAKSVTVNELSDLMKQGSIDILDVRKQSEYDTERIEGAVLFPLDFINDRIDDLEKENRYYIHCKAGYRSMTAISILENAGYKNVIDVKGGIDAMLENSDIPVTEFACQD